ncbi:MAG: hypothetical protein A4E67_00083 [Syntrophaceae bacterium PtaB.Bin038]|nr:MAG: hypothetical protein A4E67_00083 [Syntrophaceae bacterium PtaB.Bin038]
MISLRISMEMAFLRSGRLRVRMPIPPASSTAWMVFNSIFASLRRLGLSKSV